MAVTSFVKRERGKRLIYYVKPNVWIFVQASAIKAARPVGHCRTFQSKFRVIDCRTRFGRAMPSVAENLKAEFKFILGTVIAGARKRNNYFQANSSFKADVFLFLPDNFPDSLRNFLLSAQKKFITNFVTHITKFVTYVSKFVIHVTKFVTKTLFWDRKNFQAFREKFFGLRKKYWRANCLPVLTNGRCNAVKFYYLVWKS